VSDTPQVDFWRGAFGDAYTDRNALSGDALRARTAMWARVLEPVRSRPPASVLEVGANVGINLRALSGLLDADLYAVEPNAAARGRLSESGLVQPDHVFDATGDDLPLADGAVEMVFTSGVLIHVAPERLEATCREMHRVSSRLIACVEYFSVSPEERTYRDHSERLFKRDFGGFWWDLFPDLRLLDYGFFWRRATGLDDLTWWLFEKP